MLKLIRSRSGQPTLLWGEKLLHSSYNPVGEARRFVERSLPDDEAPSCILVLGAGLGYLFEAIRDRFPSSRPIGLFYSRAIYEACRSRPQESWYWGGETSLAEFLRSRLGEVDLPGLKTLEWPPGSAAFIEESRSVTEDLSRLIREWNGSYLTTKTMGRLWIRNTILNFIELDTAFKGKICHPDRPVFITASGPSLEKAVSVLDEFKDRVNLWALPSSLSNLEMNGILPDLVLMTDPGYYSISHLHPVRNRNIALAMPLSAARGARRITDRIILLKQPNLFEEELIERAGLEATPVSALGTVAASALELALVHSKAPVIYFGLDLCFQDIRSHVRPSLLYSILESRSNRIRPYYSEVCTNTMGIAPRVLKDIRSSQPLRTYAGWFEALRSDRTFRYRPLTWEIRVFREPDLVSLRKNLAGLGKKEKMPVHREPDFPGRRERLSVVRRTLENWRMLLRNAENDIGSDGNWEILFRHRDLRALSYFLDLDGLASLRGEKRKKEGLAKAADVMKGQLSFIEGLLDRVERY